jgi:hypothetical protein
MKKIAIALTLFTLSLSFSACRKIKYEEGDKLPRRKFLETINGVWEIKHGYISIDANTYTEDSVPFWNTRFGGNATLTIDYYNKLTLNWGNHNALFSFSGHKEEVGYSGFQTHDVETIEYLNDTIFRGFVQKLPLSDVNILKLDKQNLVLSKGFGNHGNRLELTKN